jgi:hypothetical protein
MNNQNSNSVVPNNSKNPEIDLSALNRVDGISSWEVKNNKLYINTEHDVDMEEFKSAVFGVIFDQYHDNGLHPKGDWVYSFDWYGELQDDFMKMSGGCLVYRIDVVNNLREVLEEAQDEFIDELTEENPNWEKEIKVNV